MPPHSPRSAAMAAASLFFLLSAASHATLPFGHIIHKNDAALPDFTAAGLVTHEVFPGAIFFADMDFPDGGDTYSVSGFGYFDQNAAFKWANYIDAGPPPGDDAGSFGPLPGNPAKYFAIYNVAGGKTRVGVGDGATLVKDFAVEFTHTADPDKVSTDITTDGKILELLDLGSTLSLVSFNPAGTLAVSKNYTGSLLLPSGSSQYAEIAANPAGGYYMMVQNSSTATVQNFIAIKLDAAGAVSWSRSFTITTSATGNISPSMLPAPDGSLLLALDEATFDIPTSSYIQKTYLVKFDASGAKSWATTITGASLTTGYFSPNSSDIWLSGSKLDLATSTVHPMAVRVTNATGAISAEFRPAAGNAVIVNGVTTAGALFTIYDSTFPNRSLLAKVATGASTAQGYVRNDTFQNGALITMRDTTGGLSSEFGDGVRAIGYDNSFQSVVAACPDYTTTSISFSTPALTSAAFNVTPAAATITAAARTTTLTNITLPIHALALKVDPFQAATPRLNLKLTTSRNAAGNFLISFPSQSGVQYKLLYSPDLKTAFTQVQTLNGTGGTVTFTVTNTSAPKGFFRISD